MVNILFTCDSTISSTMLFVKNTLNLIMIIAPILAIIYLSIEIAKAVRYPDKKDSFNKCKNKLKALAIIFFIPLFINVLMSMLGENTSVSDCWNNATKVNYNPSYISTGEDSEKHPLYTNPDDYQKGIEKPKEDTSTASSDTNDIPITSCGNLEYCNKFLTSLYNKSRQLSEAIKKNHAKVEYNYGKSVKSWDAAINIANKGGLVATTCVVPANWGITDVIGSHRVVYSVDKGGFHNYSGKITKYTKQYKFDGSMSVKTAIQKGVIQPGDIIGVKGHTFAIYSVNQKDGSAVVADGGHRFTNKCQGNNKCSPLFTYSSSTNAGYKLYQLIRWVK